MKPLILGIYILLLFSHAFPRLSEARQIGRYKSLTAHISDSFKCGETLHITIKAPNQSFFQRDKIDMQRLVGTSRAAIGFECPSIEILNIVGVVEGNEVYQAESSKSNNWVIAATDSKPKETPTIKNPIEHIPKIGRLSREVIDHAKIAKDLIIYQDDHLTVRPSSTRSMKQWCEDPHTDFLVTYNVDHSERERLFGTSYEEFVSTKILPRTEGLCRQDFYTIGLIMSREETNQQLWDKFNFETASDIIIRESYNPIQAKNHISGEEYKKLMATTSPRYTRKTTGSGELQYSNKSIKIYPHDPYLPPNAKGWCYKPELNITCDMEYEERENLLTRDYLASIIFPILSKYCSNSFVTLYFYPQKNNRQWWDMVTYTFTAPGEKQMKLEFATEGKKIYGAAGAAIVNKRARNWNCQKGMFCDLPGGLYLNAIYNNNTKKIDELDKQVGQSLVSAARKLDTQTGLEMVGISFASTVQPKSISLLENITNQYMYYYQTKSRTCLQPNAQSRTFSYTADTIRYENMYGMDMGSTGGWTMSTTYTVNSEFYPLLSSFADHWGGDFEEKAAKGLKLKWSVMTLQGAKQLQSNYKCDSSEIKQFEKNLISLSKRFLAKKRQ